MTITLCALFHVQAADLHFYFRAMAGGKTLLLKVPEWMSRCGASAVEDPKDYCYAIYRYKFDHDRRIPIEDSAAPIHD